MNKAILVIDMPDSCSKCPLFNNIYNDMYCRGLNYRGINYPYPEDFRQEWCPLKELPTKEDEVKEIIAIEAKNNIKKPNIISCPESCGDGCSMCWEDE